MFNGRIMYDEETEAQIKTLPEVPQPVVPGADVADPVRTAAVVATYQAAAAAHVAMPPTATTTTAPGAVTTEDTTTSHTNAPPPAPSQPIPAHAAMAATAPQQQQAETPQDYVMCNEKDVLMGRGKRISEWPGNQRFRTIVARHRQDYLSSLRSAKIHVAKQVIAEVTADGGRFLRELDPGNTGIVAWSKWLPVEMERCIEKTCQALREKEKTNKRKTGQPLASGPRSDGVVLLDARKLKSHENDDDLFNRLKIFREQHGHTAVPPGWSSDIDLADWATVQRRLFRDLKDGTLVELRQPNQDHDLAGFAEDEKMQGEELVLETNETLPGVAISEQQQQIVDKLQSIDFCIDYEEWHWEQSFKLFMEGDPRMKRVWLRQQRRNHREGLLTTDRRARLEAAGVNLIIPLFS